MENPIQPPAQPPSDASAPQTPTQQPGTQQPTPQPEQQPAQQPQPPAQQLPQTPAPPPGSHNGLLIAIGLLALAILLGIIIYLMRGPSQNTPGTSLIPTKGIEYTPSPESPRDTSTDSALPKGTGDTQLDQDIKNIDGTLDTTESNLGNVDQGLNDQSVNLTE